MFHIIKYWKYIMLAITVLLLAIGVVSILSRRSWALLKRTAMQYHVFHNKRLLMLLILLVLLLNCFMIPMAEAQSASASISLNYAEASHGLNPNSTRYNPSNILCDEVLSAVIERGALQGVTPADLRQTMRVAPRVQGSAADASTYFISTQYSLTYEANEKTAHLNGDTLLKLVTEAYRDWFITAYTPNVDALDLDLISTEDDDYLDVCRRLRDQADLISVYNNSMSARGGDFQASTGETFASVYTQANKVSSVMVERLEAYVLENGVSKDTSAYVSRLSFQNAFRYFDALRANRRSLNNLAAITMYEDDMARIVLVPTLDLNDQFYMSQTRIGIDDFAKAADNYAVEKADVRSTIARNNHILQQMSGGAVRSGADEGADALVRQISAELQRLARLTKDMVEEFNESNANDYLSISSSRLENRASRLALTALVLTLAFAAGVHCISFSIKMGRIGHSLRPEELNRSVSPRRNYDRRAARVQRA